jgi:DNA-binding NarL/FixJ family response regulator
VAASESRPLIRVILLARALATRVGLRALIERDRRFVVLDDAAAVPGVNASAWDEADVLILDGQGIEVEDLPNHVRALPGVVVIGGRGWLRAALLAEGGPVGLLSAEVSAEQIHATIAAVAAGLSVFEADSRSELPLQSLGDEMEAPELTVREREVLELVAAGLPNKGIAARLTISEHTVKYHLASVLTKLGAASRAEAVAQAARRGLIAL